MLEVYGSKHSLLPKIWEVEAVGIGATNNELRTPCFTTSARKFSQFQRPLSGLSIHNVRATGSYISGTNGTSNGIIPMLKVFNDTARYVDQGGGKRKGAFAIYLEPWHADRKELVFTPLSVEASKTYASYFFSTPISNLPNVRYQRLVTNINQKETKYAICNALQSSTYGKRNDTV